MISIRLKRSAATLTLLMAVAAAGSVRAETVTECAGDKFCYCVDAGMKEAIATKVQYIRLLIAQQRSQGKAIGYLSIPISTVAGSYFGVNVRVAADVKERVEERFGPRFAWVLNTAANDMTLPKGASGADYMLMWTRVLQGEDGLGQDFDFIYFVGPADFARHFSLEGRADMQKIDAYYDGLAKTDPGVTAVDRVLFRNYYALRASVSFSYGSHDEWNIARAINERRRSADEKTGLARQLGVLFEGRAVAPGLFESPVAAGNAGACKTP